ncbi:hypothetical protein [Shewanella mangrovisoli]|uniref:hypothetical protein n=1 Tax=Shewanella mangrovisoli TaxID=2864211 RepID=UPI0035B927E4
MMNDTVTALVFNELKGVVWVLYQELYPECIRNVNIGVYLTLLAKLPNTAGLRSDLHELLVEFNLAL